MGRGEEMQKQLARARAQPPSAQSSLKSLALCLWRLLAQKAKVVVAELIRQQSAGLSG